ncbi:ribosomal small subunit pseudouridine synthase A [Maledivibacter halophilus]|uniref:Pseudouridine synthase n=2 Tax=Maledivibacter halophilus TaxID=36842 RepID=A0A1T5LJ34_9FIRM|nr:pseudouridine synthase [Maledivibacter halophilus]SKC75977.1 ribosomal small subunit pseudouridine synthase A [Maledivibacter halophilus]
MNKMRLDKILGNMGYGSRKDLKKIIRQGAVKVDGEIIRKNSIHVNPYESIIEINGEKIEYRKYVYIMMNKPQGVISATYDNIHKTVIDLLDEKYLPFNIFPMGRLDIDTEGLLIITNDGKLAHEILSPKKHITKTYYANIKGFVDEEDIKAFKKGIILDDGYKTLPAELKIIEGGDVSTVELTIYEGKFHQVKRMFKSRNKKVIYLKRIAMGKLKLDGKLDLGEYKELNDEELEVLKSSMLTL